MSARKEPVVVFGERPGSPELQRILDTLSRVLGKISALVDITLLNIVTGYPVTNAAADPGTALATRTELDFLDAGIDSVRMIVRGQNSTAGSVTVQVYNTTQSLVMASCTLTGVAMQTAKSDWLVFTPVGGDEAVEVRVLGDGAMDPTLFNVHLQGRTVKGPA